MDEAVILNRVQEVVCDVLHVSPEKVTPTALFIEDLGAESLDIVTMLMELEDAFGTEIPDEKASLFRCVGDTVQYIKNEAIAQTAAS